VFLYYFLPSPFFPGVYHRSVLAPLLFNVFTTDLCDAVPDNMNICCAVESPQYYNLLPFGISSIKGWSIANCMKIGTNEN
jgi:hypothetical protein